MRTHDRRSGLNPIRDRLVGRIQERLRQAEVIGRPDGASAAEVAELQARVRRLQSLGARYGRVRLSSFVIDEVEADVRVRGGGVTVATER